MPSDKHGYGYRPDFFTVRHHFIQRRAFSPTEAATIHASWCYGFCLLLPQPFDSEDLNLVGNPTT